MAIQMTKITSQGFQASNAYGRIVEVQYFRNKAIAKLHWFKDSASADSASKIDQDVIEFVPEITKTNLVAQAYEAFKKQEHLAGATDA